MNLILHIIVSFLLLAFTGMLDYIIFMPLSQILSKKLKKIITIVLFICYFIGAGEITFLYPPITYIFAGVVGLNIILSFIGALYLPKEEGNEMKKNFMGFHQYN